MSTINFQICPYFDIKQHIAQSVEQRHIIVTIPWVTEYLAMLDFITLKMPYYISVHKILFQVYKQYNKTEKNCSYNTLLVKFSLGWLFELPHFPDLEFFANLYGTDNFQQKFHNINKNNKYIDDLNIVDQHILYTFCPFLEEIKKLLLTDVTNNNATVKHITPVSTIQSGEELTKKKLEVNNRKNRKYLTFVLKYHIFIQFVLQQQLEEALFSAQPGSVRKTIEFVSERIASACVKHICHDIVPEFKQRSLEELEGIFKESGENYDDSKEVSAYRVTKVD